ncbi:hypothetical protein QTH97_13725 [Variovorax sp. J22R24]|uniref:hypothetical protein n=1 Tax=Variovorax gracilis TaxID=3053502 RepID=UPI0025751A13|nr:hypothetical protein [Variovorax sp. J22R24]MDM0105997.1 hypothetical protein [Variovorax sp. J22R24]
MKQFLAISFAAAVCLLAGCAAPGAGGGSASSGSTGSSGITVFGTIDAGVSGYKNQSGR